MFQCAIPLFQEILETEQFYMLCFSMGSFNFLPAKRRCIESEHLTEVFSAWYLKTCHGSDRVPSTFDPHLKTALYQKTKVNFHVPSYSQGRTLQYFE